MKAIELGRKEKIDFILAVGGGSVIDSAKAIGYGLTNEATYGTTTPAKHRRPACLSAQC